MPRRTFLTNVKFQIVSLPHQRMFRRVTCTALMLFGICASAAWHFGTRELASRNVVTVKTAGKARPYLNIQEGKRMSITYRGDETLTQGLQSGAAQPRALGVADLDGNATPDLITGYAYNGAGIITVQNGNPEAFAPKDDSIFPRVQQGYQPPSLLSQAQVYSVPEPVDFLVTGDFTGDGKNDVLTAALGGSVYLFRPTPEGGLGSPEVIQAPGAITALASGNFGGTKGMASVLVGIQGTDNYDVLAYVGESGGVLGAPQVYQVPDRVNSLSLGRLDDDPFADAAVVTGNGLEIIHGGEEVDSKTAQSRIERIDTGFNVRQASVGDFVKDRNGSQEIALLSDDGGIQLIERKDLDVRPYTDEEQLFRLSHRLRLGEERAKELKDKRWNATSNAGWKKAERFQWDTTVAHFTGEAKISTTHVTYFHNEDLFVVDGASKQLKIIGETAAEQDAAPSGSMAAHQRQAMTLDSASTPTAMIALPTKLNGARDLVVLTEGQAEPNIVSILAPMTITVDRIDDPAVTVAGVGAAACTAALNDCSLRGATLVANVAANAGSTISIPAGTYTLSIDGDTGSAENGLCASPTKGDLDLTPATTINGAGAATTIIKQTSIHDRLICLDAPVNGGTTYTMTASTWAGGRDVHGVGGGGIVSGGLGDVTNLTNLIVVNNQVNSTGSPNFGSPLGGGFGEANGSLHVVGTTFGGTTVAAGCAQSSLTCGNSATGSGGAIYQQTSDGTESFSVTTSNFQNNSTGNGGGAINVASTGTSNHSSISFSTSTFTSNIATSSTSRGGAIRYESGGVGAAAPTMTIDKCTFVSNSVTGASGNGGAVASADGGAKNINMTFSRLVGNTTATTSNGQAVWGGSSNTTTINNNWWGINTGPDSVCGAGNPCDVGGAFTLSVWLQLRNVISGANLHVQGGNNHIAPGTTVDFKSDIFGLSTGGTTAAGNLTGLATFPVPDAAIYSNSTPALGSINNTNGHYSDGNSNINTTFTSNGTKGTATINALADNQTTPVNVIIGFDPEYVNPAGTDTVAGGFASAACGAGNVPCFQTIGFALTNVAISGTIHIQAGTYNESALFNTPLCQTCIGSIDGAVQLNGTLTIGTATILGNSNTFSLTGDWTNNGGTFTPGTGTVNFNSAAAGQNINGSAASQTFNNITVNKSGQTLTVGGSTTTLNLNGGLTLTAGTFAAGTAANINIAGNWTNNVGPAAFTPGTGTVTFNSTTAGQSINGSATSQTFNNLTVSKTGQTLNTGGSTTQLDLSGNFNLTAGTFTAPATMNVAGDWTRATGTTFTPGAGIVNFNSTGARNLNGTIASQTFNNVTIAKTGGGSLAVGGSTTTLGLLNMTLTSGTFDNGTAATINVTGDWTNNGGTFNPTTGTVFFNSGAAGQSINGTAVSQSFFNLTVNKTAQTLSVGGSTTTLDINGSLTLTAGTLTAPATITLAGNFDQATGTTFTPGAGVVTFDGSGAQNIQGTLATKIFNNFTVNKSANTLTSIASTTALDINGDVTLTLGTFAAGTAANINVFGNWTNNATYTAGTGTVIFDGNNNTQTISGSSVSPFNNLNNSHTGTGGVTFGSSQTVNGLLTLGADIDTSSFTLTMPATGTSAGAADVIGNVKRTGFITGGANTLSFGNPNNQISINSGTVPTDITINLVKAVPSGGIAFPTAVQRTYTITPTGGSGISATLRLHYLDSELNGNTEVGLALWRHNGVDWARQGATSADTAANWVQLTGVAQFSPWTLSSAKNDTTTTITADTPDPSLVNTAVPINWTVVSNVSGAPTVTGTVTITVNDASGNTCSAAVAAGTCNLTLTTTGSKILTATYSGDSNFNTSNDTENHDVINAVANVNDAKVPEPPSGTTNMLFTVTLSNPAGAGGASVQYATANGGATPATGGAACDGTTVDYLNTSGTASFAAGQQVQTVAVPVCADNNGAEPDETFLLNLSSPVNASIGDGQAVGTITAASTAGTLLISELRTRGSGGAGDDFVELYNNTNSPLTVAASDASAGYGVYKMGTDCNAIPVLIGTVPNGTVIPARGHYLLVGSAYSLANYGGTGAAAGNLTMSSDIEDDHNVAVFSTANVLNIGSANRLDAVGFGTNTANICDLLREGNNLPPVGVNNIEYSWFRNLFAGNPQDTNNNAADFFFADTQGTFIAGVPQHLGAPGPENLASPLRRDNTGILLPLIDSTVTSSTAPNRFRNFANVIPVTAPNGTLDIRRRVQNTTGATVTRLRFRIVDISTFPSPGASTADLRVITSSAAVISGINDPATCSSTGTPTTTPCQVTAQVTTLETPPAQPNGGGYNTTVSVSIPGGLANNASIDVNFQLGVVQAGTFRFKLIIEALP